MSIILLKHLVLLVLRVPACIRGRSAAGTEPRCSPPPPLCPSDSLCNIPASMPLLARWRYNQSLTQHRFNAVVETRDAAAAVVPRWLGLATRWLKTKQQGTPAEVASAERDKQISPYSSWHTQTHTKVFFSVSSWWVTWPGLQRCHLQCAHWLDGLEWHHQEHKDFYWSTQE